MSNLKEFGFCQKIQQYDVTMTSDYVIVSIKLYPEGGNDDYINVRNFSGRGMSGFEVIQGASKLPSASRTHEAKKSLVWIKLGLICLVSQTHKSEFALL